MDEFELIKTFFLRGHSARGVAVGVGDDAAVLDVPAGAQLVVSTDTQIAGRHFPETAKPYSIGSRALCCALSDLAAMGATPAWFTLALTLPRAEPAWLCEFSGGLFDVATRNEIALVGGDTTCGPLSISITVHGLVRRGRGLLRCGAAPGDVIFTTGSLGDGAAALALIQRQLTVTTSTRDYLLERFYQPQPRLREGALLGGVASAAIDISDGLVADLGHICGASGTGATIDVARLPLHPGWRDAAGSARAQQWALTGGDDYELCVCVPRAQLPRMAFLIKERGIVATAIGEITEGEGVRAILNGRLQDTATKGYNHFDA